MSLVCGEALFDCFLDAGKDIGSIHIDSQVGGSPFNVAIVLRRLGQQSSLLTGMSTDELGSRLVRMLESESVNTDYLVRTDRRTTVVMVYVNDQVHPKHSFYGEGSADCSITGNDLPAIGAEITGVHFGSYSLVMKPVADAFSQLMKQLTDRFISVDPNIRASIDPDFENPNTEYPLSSLVSKVKLT